MTCELPNGTSGSLLRHIASPYDKRKDCGSGKVQKL